MYVVKTTSGTKILPLVDDFMAVKRFPREKSRIRFYRSYKSPPLLDEIIIAKEDNAVECVK